MLKMFGSMFLLLYSIYLIDTHLVEPLIYQKYQEELAVETARDYRGLFLLLESIHPYLNETQWGTLLEAISSESNVPIDARKYSLWQLPKHATEVLAAKGTWVEDWEEQLLYRAINSEIVARVGPMGESDIVADVDKYYEIALIGMYSTVGLMWVGWQLYRQRKLEKATVRFSKGDLQFRAITGIYALGSLNNSFNTMADKLERLFASNRNLANAISHELRSPIARIRIQLEMLGQEEQRQAQQDYILGISEDVDDMDELVDEILSYARMERRKPSLNLQAIDVHEWFVDQCEYLKTEVATPIELQINEELNEIYADHQMMARLVRNLVTNADKFAVTKIVIGLDLRSDLFRLWVDDDGEGIPEQYRDTVFEPFVRLEKSRSKKYGGHGLGLAIVAEIARFHGGKVEIKDSALGGARVLMTWPKQTSPYP